MLKHVPVTALLLLISNSKKDGQMIDDDGDDDDMVGRCGVVDVPGLLPMVHSGM